MILAWAGSLEVAVDVRFGSKADICSAKRHVCFTPKSGHVQCNEGCPLSANIQLYSITSSARTSSVGGTVMPSALAVLRLMTHSNLVGCSTGRSAGVVPLTTWSTK